MRHTNMICTAIHLALGLGAFGTMMQTALAADYYAGKQIRIILPANNIDSGYGLYGFLASQHLGRFIPGNPSVVTSFMPGATGIASLNYMQTIAPKDGTTIAVIAQDVATFQARKIAGARYDATTFKYIVRLAPNVPVHMIWKDAPAKSIADVMKMETITGAVGVGGTHNDLPRATNALLGTKWKIVSGYPGSGDARIAMERGETQATVSPAILFKEQLKGWLDSGKVRVVVQYADFRHPLFPDVPSVVELARDNDAREILTFLSSLSTIGRGFAAPPDTNEQAMDILKKAFADMIADKSFLADADKRGAEILPMWGDELSAYVKRIVATRPEIVSRASAIVEGQ
ncbi:tripartite tricarboxylate transporter substrate-binding protein [Roseiarcaceae bacterium H3SJ34-1]|uniref:Bug family tripartite tricarboxylate transporter substrate binding protein n=1 Tax=Terripilifer ovatus TaxID=3032367 RepID=UPI003AB95EDA|nr:tripartite tricarboxylate transporter substrate-binding protein [Roseiarcaceae bacterium H3SJ34-1]